MTPNVIYMYLLTVAMVIISMFEYASPEAFSSITSLQELVNSERQLRNQLEDYIANEENRLQELKQKLKKLRNGPRLHEPDNPLEFAGHPINAYQILKMWYGFYEDVHIKPQKNVNDLVLKLSNARISFPGSVEIEGAAAGIIRLQQTYRLPTEKLAAGEIYGYQARDPLEADDFFKIGVSAMSTSDNGFAAQWLELAAANYNENSTFRESDALLKIASTHRMIGDYEAGAKFAKLAFEKEPGNYTVAREYDDAKKIWEQVNTQGNYKPHYVSSNYTKWTHQTRKNYEALCRGDYSFIERDPVLLSKLYCRYRPSQVPIVRYKEEIHNFDPFIALLVDVLTPTEADLIKRIATPSLFRATVGDPTKAEQTRERVSKVSWLWDDARYEQQADKVTQISKKVSRIVGLSTKYSPDHSCAEPLQVVNYGIGGQYEPHYDYYEDKEMLAKVPHFIQGTGDRLATFMFYLTTPVAGGATVFPRLGIRVPALKYGAAFWYNLKRSGELDPRTEHAGCPVLLGQKWVANKWIREYGQEFKRPCGLTPDSVDLPNPLITS